MYYNILVPFDGSEQSHHALDAAMKIAGGDKPAKVTVLKVAPPMNFDDSTFEIAARMAGVPKLDKKVLEAARVSSAEEQEKEVEAKIEELFESFPENVDVQIVVDHGRPHDIICDYAKANGIDCIVMGRRGLGAIQSALGSVSTAVLRGCNLPVLVVH